VADAASNNGVLDVTEAQDSRVEWADVARLHEYHPRLRAADWRSPLVRRLLRSDRYEDGQQSIDAVHRAAEDADVPVQPCLLHWEGLGPDYRQCLATYQTAVITELATLGLACILVAHCTALEITEVTRRGEKADYWLGDKELMLEVSGEQSGNIEELCATKAEQLLRNPFGKAGYVCVAVYNNTAARLRFYRALP